MHTTQVVNYVSHKVDTTWEPGSLIHTRNLAFALIVIEYGYTGSFGLKWGNGALKLLEQSGTIHGRPMSFELVQALNKWLYDLYHLFQNAGVVFPDYVFQWSLSPDPGFENEYWPSIYAVMLNNGQSSELFLKILNWETESRNALRGIAILNNLASHQASPINKKPKAKPKVVYQARLNGNTQDLQKPPPSVTADKHTPTRVENEHSEHIEKLEKARSPKPPTYNDLDFKVRYEDLFYLHSDMDLTKTERLIEEERYQCRNRRDAERIVSGRALTYQVG